MQATITTNDLNPKVVYVVAGRILTQLQTSTTITPAEATATACWQHLQEVRKLGWSDDALSALAHTYLIVGVEIAAEAIRNH
mgnify:CR=1 FL=1